MRGKTRCWRGVLSGWRWIKLIEIPLPNTIPSLGIRDDKYPWSANWSQHDTHRALNLSGRIDTESGSGRPVGHAYP